MVTQREARRRPERAKQLASGLGWFSIGLGAAEIFAPGQIAKVIGVRDRDQRRNVLRARGAYEIAAGVGILSRPEASGWMWTRVAADVVDLVMLGSAFGSRGGRRARVAAAAVVGVTALDLICGARLRRTKSFRAVAAVLIGRSVEDLYNFWRYPPNVMALQPALESVRPLGDRRWRWSAKVPGGRILEFDTEITEDQPNRRFAWRSIEGSPISLQISLEFKPGTANRGTILRGEIQMQGPLTLLAKTAHAAGFGPEVGLEYQLRRFKQLMETGEIARATAERAAPQASLRESARAPAPEPSPEPVIAR